MCRRRNSAMRKTNHVHKYKTVKLSTGRKVLKCLHGCPHYIEPKLAIGRSALCWRCNEEFILDGTSVELLKPHCEKCTNGKKKELSIQSGGPPNQTNKKTAVIKQAADKLDSLMAELLKPPARSPEKQPPSQIESKTDRLSIQQQIQAIRDKVNATRRERETK